MSAYFDEDKVQSKMTYADLFRQLWPYLLRYRLWMILSVLAIIGYSVTGRLLPMIFGWTVDHGIRQNNLQLVGYAAIAFIAVEVFRLAFDFLQLFLMSRLGNRVLFDVRQNLVRHVQSLPIGYFDKNPTGRTVTRLTNDVGALGELFSQAFTGIFISLIELGTILFALAFISFPLMVTIVLIVPVMAYLCYRISEKIRVVFREAKKKLAMINAFTAENINGMKIVQLYNRAHRHRERFRRLSSEFKTLNLKTVGLFAMLWPVVEFFNVGTIAATLLAGGYFVQQGWLTIGELSTFVLLTQGFFKPMRFILERYTQFQNSLTSAERVFQLLSEEEEHTPQGYVPEKRMKGHIHFQNLSFQYQTGLPCALENFNLEVRPGESVAIVGRTGSGKSTLISLLQKFYRVEDGKILVDGRDINTFDTGQWRRKIAVVQQDNFIFRGDLLYNIRLGHEEIPVEVCERAAQKAGLGPLLDRLPQGIHHTVEERGANLSSGERQLLGFARALAFDPDILILDEATSHVDSENERQIQKATSELTHGRTSLIIAHRLSTILDCDRIVLLEKGKIVEMGSHEELLARKGPFYKLYQSQFREVET